MSGSNNTHIAAATGDAFSVLNNEHSGPGPFGKAMRELCALNAIRTEQGRWFYGLLDTRLTRTRADRGGPEPTS